MKNLRKFEGKEVKNAKVVKGSGSGTKYNDFRNCVKDYCLTGKHEYMQNESAQAKL
jgi:hypothetical protein